MDIAGFVAVKVKADLSELEQGFSDGESMTRDFDRKASGSFERVGRSSKQMADTVRGSAARAAVANDNVAGSARRAALQMDGMAGSAVRIAQALGAIAGSLLVTALIGYADAWSDMQSRVGAAVKNMEAAPALMQRIVDIANASYSPLDQTVEIYARNVSVLRDLGRGASEAADFTESLNHMLVITATRGERAASVQNALSKAMAVGKLQADGLETVLANGGRVAEALAAELGTSVNGLRSFASQGKITGDVIANAIIKPLDEVRAAAAEMPATISDAFTRIQTNLIAFMGQMDKSVGASEAFAAALLMAADNIDRLVTYGATAVALFGIQYIAAFVAARIATMGLAGSLALLRGAMLRTGIGALVVGAGELVYQFGRLVEATGSWDAALQEVGQRAKFLLDAIVWGFRAAGDSIEAIWAGAMADILRSTQENFGGILELLGVSTEAMSGSITRLEQKRRDMEEAAKSSAIIASEQAKRAFAEIKVPGLEVPDMPGFRAPPVAELDKAAAKAAKAYREIVAGSQEFVEQQRLEASVIGMTEEAANALRYEQDLLNQARRAGLTLTEADRQGFKALAEAMAGAEERTRGLTERFEFMKDLTKGFFTDFKNDLISNMSEGMSFWESAWRAMASAASRALDKVVDKLLNEVIDAIFQVNSAGKKGGGGGGLLDMIFGGLGSLFGGGGPNFAALGATGKYLFNSGGYTGAGPASRVAGVVHGGEYVFSKAATDRIGLGYLDQLHRAGKGYSSGGYVSDALPRLTPAGNENAPAEISVPITINIDATGADTAGWARVERQLADLKRSLPQTVVATIQDAKKRRVI